MRQERETHPPAAAVDQYGQRQYTPQPAEQDIVRNFGDDYTAPARARKES